MGASSDERLKIFEDQKYADNITIEKLQRELIDSKGQLVANFN